MAKAENTTLNPFVMDDQEGSQTGKITIRLPPFWPEELWFTQLEGQFALCNINRDKEKYAYALSKIEPKQAREVKDVITRPPERDKYRTLKKALIQRLTDSHENRMRQLLEREEIGDRKPSQFLRYLSSLAGSTVTQDLLRTLWMGRLPPQMQAILAPRTADALEEVAEQADRIHELGQRTMVLATSTSQRQNTSTEANQEIEALRKEVAALTTQIARMARSMQKYQHHDRNQGRQTLMAKFCLVHERPSYLCPS
ncbi:uncharacterized protein LOC118644324 [Monomorium pharaonis]|uniref:uncharacterized protein LOC118644324 n=1 Tax=Monomorium pharaonis TaxID=307658 RepID=UPI001746863D|nr:uncharacterized protein LOC118644324 [Monomorium pharaonis]